MPLVYARQSINSVCYPSDVDGLTRYPTPVFLDADYSPEAIAVRWQGYFAGPTGFPHGEQSHFRLYLPYHAYVLTCVCSNSVPPYASVWASSV